NQPLFVLDGFETSLRTIIDLNMNRVASITILKDAASTALYGSKAANGVVVVETIKPTAGKLRINYNSDLRVEMPDLSVYNLMNSTQKLEYERLAEFWSTPSYGDIYEKIAKADQYNAILAEVKRGVDTYWLNEPLQVGTTLGHSLYASGGTGGIRFDLGVNYRNLKGVMIGSNRETWGTNISLLYRKNKLNLSNRLRISGSDANESPYGSFAEFAILNPYFRKTDSDGDITKFLDIHGYFGKHVRTIANPLYDATLNSISNTGAINLTNNFRAIWTLNRQFRIEAALQLNKSTTTSTRFVSPSHTNFRNTPFSEKGSYSNRRLERLSYRVNMMASYATVIKKKHSITANLRASAEQTDNNSLGVSAVGFPLGTNGNPAFAFGYEPNSKPGTAKSKSRRVNLLSSINYSFDRTYFFDATYRLDGSTVFGSNRKYAPFWTVGAGVNLHHALQMDPNIVSNLKLRGNIGSTGNQGFSGLSSVSIYQYTHDTNSFGQGINLQTLANPNLKWQNTFSTSLGVDASLFKNKVTVNLNFFRKKTDGLVVRVNLPSSTGVANYPINVGFMDTKGFSANL
ncbi:MAG: hypothetical protein ACWIPI_10545, partial [Polaribacter sp.]